MEEEQKPKKKVNEDLVTFMKTRPENEVPRYTAALEKYVEVKRKRRRANNTRLRIAANEGKKKEQENEKTNVNADEEQSGLKHNKAAGWFSGGGCSIEMKEAAAPRSRSTSRDEEEPSMRVDRCAAQNPSPRMVHSDSETDDEPKISMSFWNKLKKMMKCRRRRKRSCGRKRRRRKSRCGRKRRKSRCGRKRRKSRGRKRRKSRCGRKSRRRRRSGGSCKKCCGGG